jgi:tetratricopeptide (TPR) repeat protein
VAAENMGWIAIYTGRLVEAIHWFKKAIRLAGESDLRMSCLAGLGFAYLSLDDLETARQYFEEAWEIDRYNPISISGTTCLYMTEQRYDDLRDAISFYLKFAPDNPFLHHWLGIIDIMEGNLSDARLRLDKAAGLSTDRRSPFDAGGREDIQVKLAWVLWQQGEIDAANVLLDEASETLEDEIKNGNENSIQFLVLAEAECIRGNRSKAFRWLREAFDSGFVIIRLVETDPLLGDLRDDPEFKEMTADFRARIAKMRERVENSDR